MDLVESCYAATRRFPLSERFGITQQMNRAAVSVASNIAEGAGRASNRDFARFLHIAYASACELATQGRIAQRVGLGASGELCDLIDDTDEVRRMLNALIRAVSR